MDEGILISRQDFILTAQRSGRGYISSFVKLCAVSSMYLMILLSLQEWHTSFFNRFTSPQDWERLLCSGQCWVSDVRRRPAFSLKQQRAGAVWEVSWVEAATISSSS